MGTQYHGGNEVRALVQDGIRNLKGSMWVAAGGSSLALSSLGCLSICNFVYSCDCSFCPSCCHLSASGCRLQSQQSLLVFDTSTDDMSHLTCYRRCFGETLLLLGVTCRLVKTQTLLVVLRETAHRLGFWTSMAAAPHSAAVVRASGIHSAALTDRHTNRQTNRQGQTGRQAQTEQSRQPGNAP